MSMSKLDWDNARAFNGHEEMKRREASGGALKRLPQVLTDAEVEDMLQKSPPLKTSKSKKSQ